MVLIEASVYLDALCKFGVGGAHPGGLDLTKEIFKTLSINERSVILDVGCGTGQTAAYLAAQYGAKVIGLDNNLIMVEKAQSRMEKYQLPVQIIHGSIEEVPLKDDTFDLIICESVLAFVNKPKALKEILRLLKKEGLFMANELTINEGLGPSDEEEIKQFYGMDTLLMESAWISLFEQTGFKNINTSKPLQSMYQNYEVSEFTHSTNIEPQLYSVFVQHLYLMTIYNEIMDYRIFICNK